jgi:hypothetical protein
MYVYVNVYVCIYPYMHVFKRLLKKCHENQNPKLPVQYTFGYNKYYDEGLTFSCNVDLSY